MKKIIFLVAMLVIGMSSYAACNNDASIRFKNLKFFVSLLEEDNKYLFSYSKSDKTNVLMKELINLIITGEVLYSGTSATAAVRAAKKELDAGGCVIICMEGNKYVVKKA